MLSPDFLPQLSSAPQLRQQCVILAYKWSLVITSSQSTTLTQTPHKEKEELMLCGNDLCNGAGFTREEAKVSHLAAPVHGINSDRVKKKLCITQHSF